MPERFRSILGDEDLRATGGSSQEIGLSVAGEPEGNLHQNRGILYCYWCYFSISKYTNSSYLHADSKEPEERECLKNLRKWEKSWKHTKGKNGIKEWDLNKRKIKTKTRPLTN